MFLKSADLLFAALWWLCGVVLLFPLAAFFVAYDIRRQHFTLVGALLHNWDTWKRTMEDRPRLC